MQIWNTNGIKPNHDLDKSVASFHHKQFRLSLNDNTVPYNSFIIHCLTPTMEVNSKLMYQMSMGMYRLIYTEFKLHFQMA